MTKPTVTIHCPDCPSGQLVERFNTKNGSRFLGCDQYPTCTHSEPLPAYIELIRQGAPKLPGFSDA